MTVKNVAVSDEIQIVVFGLGSNEFALPMEVVCEIINFSSLVELPEMPFGMIGVIDVRGSILPVVDLGEKLNLDRGEYKRSQKQKILLIELGDSMIGYLVDDVFEAVRVPKDSIEDAREIKLIAEGPVLEIYHSSNRIIPILDADRLISEKESSLIKDYIGKEI